jgi:hypothetical protein
LDERERASLIGGLRSSPARLRAALKGLPKAVASWTPSPGKWSILEIVCHLRDMERDAYLERYRRIVAEERPQLPDVDGDRYALEKDYRSQKLADALREWTRLRRETLKLLGSLKRDQWARTGVHETAGPLSMADLLRRHAVGNDEAHIGQVEAIKRRHALLSRLEQTPRRLGEATRALPEERLRRRPASGKWSALENACHLRDVERIYAERFTKVAFSERPGFWMMDNDRVAELKRYNESDLRGVLKDFRALREDTLALLRALPHAAWQRVGRHPLRGELTLEQLAGVLADHDDLHLQALGVATAAEAAPA